MTSRLQFLLGGIRLRCRHNRDSLIRPKRISPTKVSPSRHTMASLFEVVYSQMWRKIEMSPARKVEMTPFRADAPLRDQAAPAMRPLPYRRPRSQPHEQVFKQLLTDCSLRRLGRDRGNLFAIPPQFLALVTSGLDGLRGPFVADAWSWGRRVNPPMAGVVAAAICPLFEL